MLPTHRGQTTIPTATREVEDANQARYGVVMFYVFSAAVLTITFSVCLLALVTRWWMLGVVFGIHLAVTGWVCIVINRAFDFDGDADLKPAAAAVVNAARRPRRRSRSGGASAVGSSLFTAASRR